MSRLEEAFKIIRSIERGDPQPTAPLTGGEGMNNRIALAKLLRTSPTIPVSTTDPKSRARMQRYKAAKKRKEALEKEALRKEKKCTP